MMYTIQSARYANAEITAAIVSTEEAGDVLASEQDTPELWAQMLEWGMPDDYSTPATIAPRAIAMWRALTIMEVTPRGEGTMLDAVMSKIETIEDPLQRAAAKNALSRGDTFDRDGVFVPLLMDLVGVSDEEMDEFMDQAARLPA